MKPTQSSQFAKAWRVAARSAADHVVAEARRLVSAPWGSDERSRSLLICCAGSTVTCEIFPPGGLCPKCWIHNRRFPDRAPYHESFPDLASMLERAEAQLGDLEQWRLVEVTSSKKMQERTVTPTNYSELTDECRRTLSDTETAIFRVDSKRVYVVRDPMFRMSADHWGGSDRECPDVEGATWRVNWWLSELWWPGDDVIIEHIPRAIVHPIWDSSLMKHAVRHWVEFWDESKAEFVAKTWHPSRMAQWCLDTEEQKCIAEM